MKKFVVTLLVGAFALTVCLGSVQARPAYPPLAGEHYKGNDVVAAKAKAADKCNLCHDAASKSKKDRNEFGKALSKHLGEAEFKKLAADKEALAKALGEALKATEADKHSSGKTFGEVIKAGKLPGEK
jgi:cytochrome c553